MNPQDMPQGEGPTTREEHRSARLCAYLLGELTTAEGRDIERELQADPALRAEADELAATIGLVRGELAAEPSLSATAMASLTAGAQGLLTPAAPQSGVLVQGRFGAQAVTRAAAAMLVVLGGSLVYLQQQVEAPTGTLASVEKDRDSRGFAYSEPEAPRAEESKRESRTSTPLLVDGPALKVAKQAVPETSTMDLAGEALRGLGYAGAGGGVAQPPAAASVELAVDSLSVVEELHDLGEGTKAEDWQGQQLYDLAQEVMEPKPARVLSVQPQDGYRGPGDSLPAKGGESHQAKLGYLSAVEKPISKRARMQAAALPGGGGGSGGGPATPGPAGPSRPLASQGPATPGSSDAFFLGRGSTQGGLRVSGEAPPVGGASLSDGSQFSEAVDLTYYADPGAFAEAKGELLRFQLERGAELQLELQSQGDLGLVVQSADPLERARLLAEHYLQRCRPLPNESPRDMYFRYWGDNPFVFSSADNLATFAADVDTASYNLARRYLKDGHLPTKAQVRTEEFLNSFRPDVPAPVEETFAVSTELAPSPFGGSESRWMLRVTVRGKEVAKEERDPVALTFVVDTSGSMKEDQRLELVKHALRLLVSQLDARDSIALVAFSSEARLILPMTPADQRGVIEAAIHPLAPDGGTNAEAGLKLGYELAATALAKNVHHRVVFLSDGVANIGQTDQDQLTADVQHRRDQGIYLNTIGVGMDNHNDVFLERLADQGDGICDYVDDAAAVERAIVERFTGAFIPIASDVKIQVEFDSAQALRWRQIGYENRAVADADFRNDAVDAGEIGAGHQVTALFEIERMTAVASNMVPLEPLAKVRLRWKEPKGAGKDPREAQVTESEHLVSSGSGVGHFESATPGYQRAVLAAQFAEVLRLSTHAQGDDYGQLIAQLQRVVDLPALAADADTKELLALTRRAGELGAGRHAASDDLVQALDELRRHHYLSTQLKSLEREQDEQQLADLREANDRLEQRIRDLCQQRAQR